MKRYVPYGCYYLHQGMLTALVMQGVVGYYRHAGLDLAQLSWLSLAMLPWVGKFLWAPWCERHALPLAGNRFLGSLVLLQIGMAALLAGIALIDPTRSTALVVPALMLLTLLSASHGIYANGIVICTTDERSRPIANATQVGGSYLGIPLGVFAFLAVAQHAGWQAGFLCMAALSLLLAVPVVLARQPMPVGKAPAQARPRFNPASLRALWPALALTAIYYLAMRGLMALQTVLLADQGLSLVELGQAITLFSTVASGLGVVLGGWFARRAGAWRGLLPVMALHAALACLIALGYSHFGLHAWLAVFGLVNVAAAIGFVMLYNVLMGLVQPHQPASDYALFQSVDMAVAILASMGTLRIAHHAGYQTALTLLAAVALLCLWPASRLRHRLSRRAPTEPAASPNPA
ncbi:MFS transporter [Paracidovorax anthurii]|uniref:MFS transporter (Putative signal transducer) n=1 Tax=Paracidovorax anthurii TaxID=78229 RepID=A0A328ZIK6_9BURK|nr:MFS transporter [Paracidovorax anthurii]RAR82266.1 MFS transporter (putative signal transducer) [Paracidovorax anthurii]